MNKNYSILLEEYIHHNGRHFNESLAKRIVSEMWHEDKNKKIVEGEAVTVSEAMSLLEGMTQEKQVKMQWDAYVAANAFVHDTANAEVPKAEIMRIARYWWFHDDDFDDECHKVFWYFFK